MGKSNIVISSMSRQWAGASRQWQPPTDVFESAHSIKGASGNLGFHDIFAVAKEVEMNARENSLDGASEAVGTIRERIQQLALDLDERKKIG